MVNQTNVAPGANTANRGSIVSNSINNDNTAGDTNADGDIVQRRGACIPTRMNYAYAVRPLASTLQVGQTISVDMSNT